MAESGDERLLILTHRLPFVFQRTSEGLRPAQVSGGLASALDPMLRKRGGTWLGWPGIEMRPGERVDLRGAPYRVAALSLSESEVARYYHGLSGRALWPLLHSFPSRARFDRHDWPSYRKVNRRFASAALRELRESDVVWVHDYQLMLAPLYLRRLLSRARIAFFLHVPFPPFDIFRLLPWVRELLRGFLACDLVGFQVESSARNFLDCVHHLIGAEIDATGGCVRSSLGETRTIVMPIGIDFETFESKATSSPHRAHGARILLAADRLFEKFPQHREKVVLIQIAMPSRHQVAEYRSLKREIEELVGRVNGRFASAAWEPIRYLYRRLDHDELAGLYRDSDVLLATPLRDGMNLVAKEFVACQTEEPGVLVLSHLAGAAETMREALLVNPFDIERTADRIHEALAMSAEERYTRMKALRVRERRDDVHAWVEAFLEAVSGRIPATPPEN